VTAAAIRQVVICKQTKHTYRPIITGAVRHTAAIKIQEFYITGRKFLASWVGKGVQVGVGLRVSASYRYGVFSAV